MVDRLEQKERYDRELNVVKRARFNQTIEPYQINEVPEPKFGVEPHTVKELPALPVRERRQDNMLQQNQDNMLEDEVVSFGQRAQQQQDQQQLQLRQYSIPHNPVIPKQHFVVSRSHLFHLTPPEWVHSFYNTDKPVSNVDVIDVRIHLTTTIILKFTFESFLIEIMWRFKFTTRQCISRVLICRIYWQDSIQIDYTIFFFNQHLLTWSCGRCLKHFCFSGCIYLLCRMHVGRNAIKVHPTIFINCPLLPLNKGSSNDDTIIVVADPAIETERTSPGGILEWFLIPI